MAAIDELNTLCVQYLSQKEAFDQKSRIRKIFTEFIKEGYSVVTSQFDPSTQEYRLLSALGRVTCDRMILTRIKKLKAIAEEKYEFAADLRDLERELEKRVVEDFSSAISNRFFVLKSEETKEILYVDHAGQLHEFFI